VSLRRRPAFERNSGTLKADEQGDQTTPAKRLVLFHYLQKSRGEVSARPPAEWTTCVSGTGQNDACPNGFRWKLLTLRSDGPFGRYLADGDHPHKAIFSGGPSVPDTAKKSGSRGLRLSRLSIRNFHDLVAAPVGPSASAIPKKKAFKNLGRRRRPTKHCGSALPLARRLSIDARHATGTGPAGAGMVWKKPPRRQNVPAPARTTRGWPFF